MATEEFGAVTFGKGGEVIPLNDGNATFEFPDEIAAKEEQQAKEVKADKKPAKEVDIEIVSNSITSITIINGGYGYENPPIVTISEPGSASTATASLTANINSSGFVTSISLNNQQGFFDNTTEFSFPSPILTNCLLSPTINGASISNISIVNPGAGYTSTASNNIKFTGGGLSTSTYRFGSSSSFLDGTTQDINSKDIGSDIFRDGRVDFFLKLGSTPQAGELVHSNGLYGTCEWKISLKNNYRLNI